MIKKFEKRPKPNNKAVEPIIKVIIIMFYLHLYRDVVAPSPYFHSDLFYQKRQAPVHDGVAASSRRPDLRLSEVRKRGWRVEGVCLLRRVKSVRVSSFTVVIPLGRLISKLCTEWMRIYQFDEDHSYLLIDCTWIIVVSAICIRPKTSCRENVIAGCCTWFSKLTDATSHQDFT
jgi:hypothetical protein